MPNGSDGADVGSLSPSSSSMFESGSLSVCRRRRGAGGGVGMEKWRQKIAARGGLVWTAHASDAGMRVAQAPPREPVLGVCFDRCAAVA